MVKIIINENQINKIKKIIREALLKEALSKKVYHFTTLSSVMDIINDDRFVLSSSLIGDSDDFKKNKKFFISLTRQRNGSIGYSKPYNVRICFDGDKLNERFSGKPIDYWSNDMGKQTYYRALNRNEKIPYNQTNTESEDRLFFNEPVIENIMQYIERIDILINKENENNLKIAKNISLSAYRSKIFFYDNKKDFNFQTVNTINDFIENNIPYQEFKLKRQVFENVGYNLSQLMTFIINCENIYNNKEADIFVGKLLKKYGLEKYISKVLSNINIACGSTFIANYDLNWMKSLHDKDFYIKISRLVRDWLKKHNYDSLKTAKLHYEYKSNHRRKWDFEKEIKALVLRRRYGKTIIPYPETTSFWAVFPNARHWFIDDIMNNIISHNSKTDEHFKKYLQHLVKNDISVNKMLEVLSKLNVDKDVIDSLLEDGKFMWEDISLRNIGNYTYLSKEDEENFEDNFLTN